jgi:methylase of polypeptide subunit release factors
MPSARVDLPDGPIVDAFGQRRIVHGGLSVCGHHSDHRVGTVLDPFLGSGTTALVARKNGRHCVGIEINEKYCAMAAERNSQLSLLAKEIG